MKESIDFEANQVNNLANTLEEPKKQLLKDLMIQVQEKFNSLLKTDETN